MKNPSFGVDSRIGRFVRSVSRLVVIGAAAFGAAGVHAQNLAVTTLASGFNNPYGVVVDAAGNAYVADTSSHVVRKVTSAGVVSTLAGTLNTSGFSNTLPGTFSGPRGIAINSAGTVLYVADTGNHAIRVITLSGVGGTVAGITTLAGTGSSGALDSGAASTFNFPAGVAVNPAGDTLYVADRNNNAIRSIVIAGPTVATLAISGGTLNAPTGVAVNSGATALFVADSLNHVIRRNTLCA